ncbi:MAG TPA: GNAT family N-acetyltransferase [Aliidongia sp.]|uniref:GNAT family N-acetyltransferase n=1 Tax=Aliidongia sp. TaxID=1914230 RepID=UPI002DDD1EDC|nr:GNAT family N-acetyltransferase [Aliidongia sp.]HEV2678518.1 GNAT family N-acetyltransferase [Aliidongia sp.]
MSATAEPIVRPLEPGDHDRWDELWRGYLTFYETTIADEIRAVTWARLLDPAEPMKGALAFRDGVAVGLVHHIQHRSCWTVGDYVYLQDLYVSESLRGGGVGRALIEHVYAHARSIGCSRVHWLTHETNLDAMKLYDRIADPSGFVQYRKIL